MSDGETPEEAIANGKDALAAWLKAAQEAGRDVPRPGELPSGKFVARIPRSLHARLAARANYHACNSRNVWGSEAVYVAQS